AVNAEFFLPVVGTSVKGCPEWLAKGCKYGAIRWSIDAIYTLAYLLVFDARAIPEHGLKGLNSISYRVAATGVLEIIAAISKYRRELLYCYWGVFAARIQLELKAVLVALISKL
ncbi:hypothetical protein U1Q18_031866, partial [Sarracenia purpurea var. burkii]